MTETIQWNTSIYLKMHKQTIEKRRKNQTKRHDIFTKEIKGEKKWKTCMINQI